MPTPNTPPANPTAAPETVQAAPQVKPPETQQTAGAEAIHAGTHAATVALRGTIDADMKRFVDGVKSGDFDFEGDNNDTDTVENNPKMIYLNNSLKAEFADTQSKNNAPDEFQKPWRQAVINYVLADVSSFSLKGGTLMQSLSTMGDTEIDDTIKNVKNPDVVGRRGQKGVGTFEVWIENSPQKAPYETWKANEPKKQEINKKITETETKMAAIEGIVPQTIKEQLSKLKIDVNADNGSNIPSFEIKLTELTGALAKYEELKPLTESAEIPAEKRTEIINKLKAGQITPEVAKQELEAAKTGSTAEAEEETPTLDKAKSWVESLPKEGTMGKLRSVMLKVTTLVTALFAKIAMSDSSAWLSSFLGITIRGSMVSNEYLFTEHKDAKAELALKTEALFKKIGLPKSIANKFGEKKPAELIAKIRTKPGDITSKTELHPKLVALADELEKKGGKGIDATLFTFVGSHQAFAGIQAVEAMRLAQLRTQHDAATKPAETPATPPQTVAQSDTGTKPTANS